MIITYSMKLDYLLFCDSFLQEENGKLSILGAFDQVSSSGFPSMIEKMAIVLRIGEITTSNISVQLDIRLRNAAETIGTFSMSGVVDLRKTNRHQVALNAANFPMVSEGEYVATVTVNGESLGSESFVVARA